MKVEGVILDYGRTLYDPVESALFPDSIPTLEALQDRDIPLGLVTLAVSDDVEQRIAQLAEYGLLQYFQAIDVIARSLRRKSFARVLQELGISPERTVIAGDNVRQEITEGNRIGAHTVWLAGRAIYQPRADRPLEHPDNVIARIGELVELVDDLRTEE